MGIQGRKNRADLWAAIEKVIGNRLPERPQDRVQALNAHAVRCSVYCPTDSFYSGRGEDFSTIK
jgi:hypothetical protein